MSNQTVTVSADDLRTILAAINGPAHHIRELQAIRSLGDSPIDRLIAQFNDQTHVDDTNVVDMPAEPVEQPMGEGKQQWDDLAAILGADGDNVDEVMRKARTLAQPKTFDRTIETPRRQQAVERLLSMGWTYHHEHGWVEPNPEQAVGDRVVAYAIVDPYDMEIEQLCTSKDELEQWRVEGTEIVPLCFATPRPAVAAHAEVTDSRATFESWAKDQHGAWCEKDHHGRYNIPAEESMWLGWQAALAAHPHTGYSAVPEFSRTKPVAPGYYLIRGFNIEGDGQQVVSVEVRQRDDGLVVNLHEKNSDGDMESWYRVDDIDDEFQWATLAVAPEVDCG